MKTSKKAPKVRAPKKGEIYEDKDNRGAPRLVRILVANAPSSLKGGPRAQVQRCSPGGQTVKGSPLTLVKHEALAKRFRLYGVAP